MNASFADPYIDRLFDDRNMLDLYHVVSVASEDRQLPEEFWLFSRLMEWIGAIRSGIWQYYEVVSEDVLRRMSQDLEQFGLLAVAMQCRFGRDARVKQDYMVGLDQWIDANEDLLQDAAFGLIKPHRSFLYKPV